MSLNEQFSQDIQEWIDALSASRDELSGMSVCPFAKRAKYSVVHVSGEVPVPDNLNFELVIYVFPDSLSQEHLHVMATDLNATHSEMVFLPDHKDRATNINGVATNNGKHNLLLCQPKYKLRDARAALRRTSYYSHWDEQYLKEILGEDYGNMD